METMRSNYNAQEILDILKIKPYFLRFWESEFEQVSPITSETGQKIYTPKDLIILKKIKQFLSVDQLTIQKAKSLIQKEFDEYNFKGVEFSTKEEIDEMIQEAQHSVREKPQEHNMSVNFDFSEILNKLELIKSSIQKIKKELI